jgi:hypothetical protein
MAKAARAAPETDFRTEVRDGMRIDWDVPTNMDDGLVRLCGDDSVARWSEAECATGCRILCAAAAL